MFCYSSGTQVRLNVLISLESIHHTWFSTSRKLASWDTHEVFWYYGCFEAFGVHSEPYSDDPWTLSYHLNIFQCRWISRGHCICVLRYRRAWNNGVSPGVFLVYSSTLKTLSKFSPPNHFLWTSWIRKDPKKSQLPRVVVLLFGNV